MKLTHEEKAAMATIDVADLNTPLGVQIANAMRRIWAIHAGRHSLAEHRSFSPKEWQKRIVTWRTRWTGPLDGDSHHRTPYDEDITKLRAEGWCLRVKGFCANDCPTPGVGPCPHAITDDCVD